MGRFLSEKSSKIVSLVKEIHQILAVRGMCGSRRRTLLRWVARERAYFILAEVGYPAVIGQFDLEAN